MLKHLLVFELLLFFLVFGLDQILYNLMVLQNYQFYLLDLFVFVVVVLLPQPFPVFDVHYKLLVILFSSFLMQEIRFFPIILLIRMG